MKKQPKTKITTRTIKKKYLNVECPYCGKYMESEYAKQLNFNYMVHVATCKKNPRKNEQ